jgi:hypothetical protein
MYNLDADKDETYNLMEMNVTPNFGGLPSE